MFGFFSILIDAGSIFHELIVLGRNDEQGILFRNFLVSRILPESASLVFKVNAAETIWYMY